MLRFVPDHLKTKMMCKNAVKKLLFVISYVTNQYTTQEICENEGNILESRGKLMLIKADC